MATRADLTAIAAATGRKVIAAWSDHDEGAMGSVFGVVMHHTGTSQATASRAPTLQIVREGRSDLKNALCNFYIDKDGVIYLVTACIAWHAGVGSFRGITDGNGHFFGIEAESDGVTWTTATVDAYVCLVAEILRWLGRDTSWAIRHATFALPAGRKTDFAGLSEAAFMARVQARLSGEDIVTEQDKRDIAAYVWTFVKNAGDPHPYDRIVGEDVKTGEIEAKVDSVIAQLTALGAKPATGGTVTCTCPTAAEIALELSHRLAA